MLATAVRKERRYPRVTTATGIWVAWKTGARHNVSPIRTVGLGGMFIFEDDPLPEGTMLQLVFQLPGGKDSVRARATVRLAEVGRGMGVEFVQMSPAERARLSQLMKKLTQATSRVN